MNTIETPFDFVVLLCSSAATATAVFALSAVIFLLLVKRAMKSVPWDFLLHVIFSVPAAGIQIGGLLGGLSLVIYSEPSAYSAAMFSGTCVFVYSAVLLCLFAAVVLIAEWKPVSGTVPLKNDGV